MRILFIVVLLVTSGAAWAKRDAGLGARYDDRHGEHRTKKGRDAKSQDERHAKKKIRTRQQGYNRQYSTSQRQQHGHASSFNKRQKSHRGHHAPRWRRAEQFRTRRHHASDPVIQINARVNGLGITGLKRNAYIHEAYVEFGNGRIVPLREFEGRLHRGQQATRYFKQPRYVRRLILNVESIRRAKRAYVGVDYLPSRKANKARYH